MRKGRERGKGGAGERNSTVYDVDVRVSTQKVSSLIDDRGMFKKRYCSGCPAVAAVLRGPVAVRNGRFETLSTRPRWCGSRSFLVLVVVALRRRENMGYV